MVKVMRFGGRFHIVYSGAFGESGMLSVLRGENNSCWT